MRVLQVNSVCGSGSTGNICVGINKEINKVSGYDGRIVYFWGKDCSEGIKLSNEIYEKSQALLSRLTGKYGFVSHLNSKKVIKYIESFKPDIVHLHNVHDHTLNIEMLLQYLAENKIKVVWTFHDCWAFTAYCAYFSFKECYKWKKECKNCSEFHKYSWFFDQSNYLYNSKKELLENLDLHIVTPSNWLKELVQDSYLNKKDIQVIYNGIDLNVFKPTFSDFRKKYNIENKFMLLGVAFDWNFKKGIDIFIKLANLLDDSYQIVLVGTNNKIDKMLPKNVISIHRTNDISELAEIYTAADLFVNPTREEVLGMVNIESLACGTPVIMFNTGGAPECINNDCGVVLKNNNVDDLLEGIIKIKNGRGFSSNQCIDYATQFDQKVKYNSYLELYREIMETKK